jgi:hypothetical protein
MSRFESPISREYSHTQGNSDEIRECVSFRRSQVRIAPRIGGAGRWFSPGCRSSYLLVFKGVSLAGEGLPVWKGKPMFPLLQIRIDELPVIPEQLKEIALLVLFHNMESHPFDQPHGEGWLIREYATLEGLNY